MDQEQIRETAANIIQAMKNRDLAVMLAEAVLDGKYVLWNQSHIDHANRETGCTITLDDIDYVRALMANAERTANNAEIERIAARRKNEGIYFAEDKERLKNLLDRNKIIQNALAAHYNNLSAFRSA